MGIVDIKLLSKLATTQKIYKVDIPDMENSHEFILNMGKDLRKWCHENYHFISFESFTKMKDEVYILSDDVIYFVTNKFGKDPSTARFKIMVLDSHMNSM